MTVEEIEIIVTAKVEEALREFYKMKPQLMKIMKEVSKEISKVDFNELNKTVKTGTDQVKKQIKSTFNPEKLDEGLLKATEKLYAESLKKTAQYTKSAKEELSKMDMQDVGKKVAQATKQVTEAMNNTNIQQIAKDVGKAMKETKDKLEEVKDVNKSNEIELDVNNEDALKQITQLEKEIESLQKKIREKELKLSITQDTMSDMRDKATYTEGINIPFTGGKRANTQEHIEYAKNSFADAKLEDDSKFKSLSQQADKLNVEISKYNSLLESAKSKLNTLKNTQEQTNTKTSKLKSIFNAVGSGMKGTFNILKSILSAGGKVASVFKKFTPNLSGGMKSLLKYAATLFSLKSVYNTLNSAGQAWLSSQDSGAKQLSANIDYMKYALGSAVAPVIQYVTNLFYQLLKAVQSVIHALFKVNIFAKAGASAYNSMANNANKASKANKSLAGIHSEINNVSSSSGDSSGSSTSTPSFDLSEVNPTNSLLDAIKNGNWYEVGKTLGEKLNEAMNSIPWDKIQEKAKNIGNNVAQFINGGVQNTNWNKVGNTIAQGVNTAITFTKEIVQNTEWNDLGKGIGSTIASTIKDIEWGDFWQTVFDGIAGLIDVLNGVFVDSDYTEAQDSFVNGLLNADMSKFSQSVSKFVGWLLMELVLIFTGIKLGQIIYMYLIKPAIEDMKTAGKDTVLGFFEGIGNAFSSIGQWIYDNMFKPFIDGFKSAFGIHSPSTVMEEQGNFIIEGLKNGLLGIWDKVSSIFTNLGSKIKEKFTEIKDNLSSWAEKTKSKIRDWATTSKDKIAECWTNASNIVKDKIGNLKTNIFNGLNDAKSTITNFASNAWTWGKDLIDNMASGIRNNISNITNAVSSVASKIKSFLGFSEPEDGPLSNFHTYMPDMIDLMTKGIKGGIGKVKNELENLTSQMSYTINTPDFNYYGDSVKPYISQNIDLKSPTFLYDIVKNALSSNDFNDKLKVSLALTAIMGNKKIGQIAIDEIKDVKRQTGGDLELIFE